MDLDAALARQLQAEEQFGAGQAGLRPRGGASSAQQAFLSRLQGSLQQTVLYEDELLQAIAQSVMPLDRLTSSADSAAALSASIGEQPVRQAEDLLAQELLAWFKHEFFTWVNSPPCSHCSSTDMRASGGAAPTAEEAASDAGRVELHTCNSCHCITRFPRYNSPAKLLETRRGRCGEWANCFTLCCRAAGLEARYIMDWTDHVWTEYYSHAHQRWIHLDPCEAAYDKPLLYEAGWGKQLSYVIAFSRHGVADVMRRYSKQWDQLKRRRILVGEDWLSHQCKFLTDNHRRDWTSEERNKWEQVDRQEQYELADHANAATTPQEHSLPGRQTGSEGWRAARGELGSAPSSTSSVGTAFKMPDDDRVQGVDVGRLCGGVVRASGEHSPHQTALRAFDGGLESKWLDFGGANGGETWLEYRLLPAQPAVPVTRYSLTAAEDEPNRDPRDFVLEGSIECPAASGSGTWKQLDEQQGVTFPSRHHTHTFTLQHPIPCRSFRLRITAVRDPATANSVQLAKLDLYTATKPLSEPPAPLSAAVRALQAACSKAANSSPDSAIAKVVDTLMLVLVNIALHPSDDKFMTVKLENVKIKAMLLTFPEAGQVLRAAGFQETHLPRKGKQPPEAALTLTTSDTATQNILHALTLLQSPDPLGCAPAEPSSQDQGQEHAAQPQQHPPDTAAGGPGGEASGRTAGSLRLGTDMQMTDATAAPAVLADADSAADVGVTAEAAAVPDTPMAQAGAAGQSDHDIGANIEAAGSLHASQQATHQTPAPTQADLQTPAAPQRQEKPSADTSTVTQMHKLQLQTPHAEGTQAVTPSQGGPTKNMDSRAAEQPADALASKTDLKALIHQEFAKLMATQEYTPNQAAALAVQRATIRR